MKIKKRIILLIALCFHIITSAQVAQNVAKSFPARIVYQIDNIVSKVKLDEAKQFKIAQKMKIQDSIANTMLAKGTVISQLKEYYTIDKNFLTSILSREELDQYLYELDQNNRFLLALKMANTIKLEPNQIDEIRKQNDFLNVKNITDVIKKNQFYNKQLDTILNKKQYIHLVNDIYAKQSKQETNNDWNDIQKMKLVSSKDSVTVYNELYKFNLYKNRLIDPNAKKFDSKKAEELIRFVTLDKQPPVLTRYRILADYLHEVNVFATAIKFEKKLNLTTIQIDSLLQNYRTIELKKFNDRVKNPFAIRLLEYNDFENKKITSILDPQQLDELLIKKNEITAIVDANKNWVELEKKEMVKDLDKNTTLKEFATYQLKFLVASERLRMNRNATNAFYKRDIELKKPDLLKQLDDMKKVEQTGKTTKNALKW